MSKFQCPGAINSIKTLNDGSLNLTINTPEVCPEEMTKLFELHRKEGWFHFALAPLEEKDLEIPEVKVEFKNDKTPSQRLRNVIFVWWEQLGSKGSFDSYYKKVMENLIEQIKEKLD